MAHDQIQDEDFTQPALLTIWPSDTDAKATQPRELPNLHDALKEAFRVLRCNVGSPWIVTAGGLILTPAALLEMMPAA